MGGRHYHPPRLGTSPTDGLGGLRKPPRRVDRTRPPARAPRSLVRRQRPHPRMAAAPPPVCDLSSLAGRALKARVDRAGVCVLLATVMDGYDTLFSYSTTEPKANVQYIYRKYTAVGDPLRSLGSNPIEPALSTAVHTPPSSPSSIFSSYWVPRYDKPFG